MLCRDLENLHIDAMTPTASTKQENAVRDSWEVLFTAQVIPDLAVLSTPPAIAEHNIVSMYLQRREVSASSDALSDDTGDCGERRFANTQVVAFLLPTLPDDPKSLSDTRNPEPERIEYVTPTEETKEVHARRSRSMRRVCGHHARFNEAACEPDQCIVDFAESHVPSPSTRRSNEDILEVDRRFLDDYGKRQDVWHSCTAESTKMSPDDDDNDNHFGFCRAAMPSVFDRHLKEVHLEKRNRNRHEQNDNWEVKGRACYAEGTARRGFARPLPKLQATRQSQATAWSMALWRAAILRTCTPKARTRQTSVQSWDCLEPKPDGQDVLMDRCFLETAQNCGVGFAT